VSILKEALADQAYQKIRRLIATDHAAIDRSVIFTAVPRLKGSFFSAVQTVALGQSVTYCGAAIWSLSGKSGHGSHAGWLMVTHCAGSAALLYQV
jgi:hypothetical protein